MSGPAARQRRRQATPAPADKAAVARPASPAAAPAPQAGRQVSPAPAATPVPAYVQARLKAGASVDPAEREADEVAAQVARRPAAPGGATAPVPAAQRIQAGAAPASAGQTIQRRASAPASGVAPAAAAPGQARGLEARIEARRGAGASLPADVLGEMEAGFGHDFSDVGVHADAEAAALCAETGARAFTYGTQIFFAPGEYAPHTDAGRELLAHELTHVVQQARQGRRIQRQAVPEDNGQPHADPVAAAAYRELCSIDVPAPKARHLDLYRAWAGSGRLMRPRGRRIARNTNQISNWNSGVAIDESGLRNKLQAREITVPTSPGAKIALSINGRERLERTLPELQALARLPTWDRAGSPRRFQVDHKIEYQVASRDGAVDTLVNYELFDPYLNRSSGGTLMAGIRRKVQGYLSTIDPYRSRPGEPKATWAEAGAWLAGHDIVFTEIRAGAGTPNVEVGGWSQADIEALKPFDNARPVPDPAKGSASEFVLASGQGGFQLARLRHQAAQSSFAVPDGATARAIAGLRLQQVSLDGGEADAAAGTVIGSAQAAWDLPEAWQPAQPGLGLALKASGEYIGYPDQIPPLQLDFRHLSPVRFETVEVREGMLFAEGTLTPSIPILGAPLTVRLRGRDLTFSLDYGPDRIHLPIPRTTIDDAYVSVFYSTVRGLGVGGQVQFSIEQVGSGELSAAVSTSGGLALEGGFDFQPALFDRARVRTWWRDGAFGAEGTLGIDTPDRIRGIRSATATVRLQDGLWAFDGSAELSVPGVEQAAIAITQGEDGLTIAGDVALAANPAIRSGSLHVQCLQSEGQWQVSASGTAQPAIPGIDSEFTVAYDQGVFDASFSGAFSRGMLSGRITAGATNRAIGEDGEPAGEVAPGTALIVYGGGEATVRIAPWLQGTAGLALAPDGEVTVSGEIALPDRLEIFRQLEYNRRLFGLAAQFPIIPGLVAEVGGNLSASASIGPGAFEQFRIGITYNPAREEQTHVTGDALLRVPAQAGLRLGARAGIGLGIPGASATGGLEIGGALGISGAAEASVHVDWTPGQGLEIAAQARLHAQPAFRFDVSGYVAVTALGFSVYEERFELAALELGSGLEFGVRFPVDYREGEPFALSMDDVEFEVPDIDPMGLVQQLGAQLG